MITFYDWPYSPFCMKVRAILDYKRLEYRSVNPLRHVGMIRRRGGIGKVPALDIDGELIVDSTDIAYALDARFPDPPLLPADPRQRGLAHALEDWADESLYFIGLYYRWYEAEGRKPIAGVFRQASPLLGAIAYHFYLRLVLGQIRKQGTLRKSPEHVAKDLERHLEAIEAILSRSVSGGQASISMEPGPFLLGDQPYLCDFALWGQLNYLNRTPVGKAAIAGRAAIGTYLERISALSR